MINTLQQLENLLRAWIRLAKNKLALFEIELKLAKLIIKPLLFCILVLVILLVSLWFSVLCLLCYEIYLHTASMPVVLLSIIVVNLLLLIAIYRYISYLLRQGSFYRTRRNLLALQKEKIHDE